MTYEEFTAVLTANEDAGAKFEELSAAAADAEALANIAGGLGFDVAADEFEGRGF